MSEVSATRLYLGNLPRTATKEDIEEHFTKEGDGKITEIKVMNGFGFIEYENALDARDVVPSVHGSDFKGERLTVQFARGPRHKDNFSGGPNDRQPPRPRRTMYRMQITGLPTEASWQDLKDFARQSGVDVVYSETGRERDGKGFVEFDSAKDLETAVSKVDGTDFKGSTVHCTADIQEERPQRDPGYRSRTPPHRYGQPGSSEYDRRDAPPRGYSPSRGYRERSPGRRYNDYARDYDRRSPPPRDRYGYPPRSRHDDPYGRPPPNSYADRTYPRDPYAGSGRRTPPPQYGGYPPYEERGYRAPYY